MICTTKTHTCKDLAAAVYYLRFGEVIETRIRELSLDGEANSQQIESLYRRLMTVDRLVQRGIEMDGEDDAVELAGRQIRMALRSHCFPIDEVEPDHSPEADAVLAQSEPTRDNGPFRIFW